MEGLVKRLMDCVGKDQIIDRLNGRDGRNVNQSSPALSNHRRKQSAGELNGRI